MGAPADSFRLRCRMPDSSQARSPNFRQQAPRSGGSSTSPLLLRARSRASLPERTSEPKRKPCRLLEQSAGRKSCACSSSTRDTSRDSCLKSLLTGLLVNVPQLPLPHPILGGLPGFSRPPSPRKRRLTGNPFQNRRRRSPPLSTSPSRSPRASSGCPFRTLSSPRCRR